MPFCCNLTLTPKMYEWHVQHDHKIVVCKMCRAPILNPRFLLQGASKQACCPRCRRLRARLKRNPTPIVDVGTDMNDETPTMPLVERPRRRKRWSA